MNSLKMACTHSTPPSRWRARGPAVWCVAALAVAMVPGGVRADLFARADFSYNLNYSNTISAQYFHQYYQLGWNQSISDRLFYRLGLQFVDDRGSETSLGQSSQLRANFLNPSALLGYATPELQIQFTYDLRYYWAPEEAFGGTPWRRDQRLGGTISYVPSSAWITRLSVDHLGNAAETGDNDQSGTRVNLSGIFTQGFFQAVAIARLQSDQNAVTQSSITAWGPTGGFNYQGNLLDGKLAVNVRYLFDYFRTETTSNRLVPVTALVEIAPVTGLYVKTDLPNDTSRTPMVPTPALVDRNFTATTGIALGPDGSSFQNIGVDMGRSVPLDQMRIWVVNALGNPIAFGGPVTWTAYWSLDGTLWTPFDVPVTSSFDVTRSAYVLDFPKVTARYFKAVSFGVNTVETYVTEMQVFANQLLAPNQTVVGSTLLNSGSLYVGYQVLPFLNVSYSGNGNLTRFDAADLLVWSRDLNNTFGFLATLPAGFSLSSYYSLGSNVGFGIDRNSQAVNGTLTYRPIPAQEISLTGRWGVDVSGAYRQQTLSAGVRDRTDLHEAVNVQLGVDYTRVWLNEFPPADYLSTYLLLGVRVWSTFDVRLQSTLNRNIVVTESSLTPSVFPQQILLYSRHTLDLFWHPSDRLTALARFGFGTAASGSSGLIQTYNLQWNPFNDGAVQFTMNYTQDIDPVSGSQTWNVSAWPRWRINRHAYLDLTYVLSLVSGPLVTVAGPTQQLILSLSLNL